MIRSRNTGVCSLVLLILSFCLISAGRASASADFSLSPTSAGLGLTQGGSGAESTVTVVPSGGFTGSVTLSASTLPTGITASYGTNPVASGSSSSAINFTASSSAALGASAVTITGTSGSLVHTTVITLYVVGTKAFSLYGSGSSGTQTIGSVDSNFTMVSSFPGYTTTPIETGSLYVTTESSNWPYPGVWLADAPGFCYWISPQQSYTSSSSDPSGFYIYEQKFNLNGFDATTAAITGAYAADDNVTMYLNGVVKVGTAGGYATTRPFTISSGFCNGVNSLDLVVQNTSAASGLFWGITSTTATAVTGGPTIATAASASPNPVTGTTTSLSVLGAEGGNDTGLTYTWATTGTPPAAVTYSANGTNAAKNITATFTKAGLYQFQVTVTDAIAKTATSLVAVLVSQTDTSVVMTPTTATLATGSVRNFKATASDQFGNVLTTQPTWTWTAATGTITSAGVYTAPSSAGSDTVTATDPATGKYATAAVTISTTASFTLSASPTSRSVNQGSTSSTNTITVTGASGFNGTVTLSASGLPTGVTVNYGTNPITTSGGISFTATPLATVGTSTVTITGTSGSLTATTTITLTVVANSILTTIAVSPSTASVIEGLTQQFTATAYDQNGVALTSQPTFTWTATGDGTVSTAGLFTAGATTGTATVKAASGSISNTSAVTVITAPPPSGAAITVNTATPITGTTASLTGSATGTGTLTYAWSVSPSSGAVFSPTSGANTTLTFPAAGTYTVTLTVTDPYSQQTTATKSITVNQTVTSIAVSPASAALNLNGSQTLTASATDQFGTALSPQPTFTWSVESGEVGSITSRGVYSAGTTAGTATVQAVSGSVTGTASITVTNAAPTVANAASASPSPVTGTTSNLSVLGADDGGEPNLTYTWTYTGPTGVTFSANGTNATKNTTATFTQAGTYTFTATITDAGSLTTTSAVTVTVNQTPTTVAVFPASEALVVGATQAFTAIESDQFGNALAPTWTWSAARGSITTGGNYTAPSMTGSDTVTAKDTVTGLVGTAALTISGIATHFVVTAPSNATAGTPVSVTVTALDASNNTATAYAGLIQFASTDLFALLPANSTLTNGTGVFSITLNKAGSQTITATDTVTASIGGTSGIIAVAPNATVSAIAVYPETSAIAPGSTQQFTAKAVDNYGNTIAAPPTYAWSVLSGAGTINSSTGLFTAPSGAETDTIQATVGSVSATATISTAPPTATNLVAMAGNGSVTLTWTPDQNGNSYTIYRSRVSGGEGSIDLMSNITSIPYVDSAVINGDTYYYKVCAVNSLTGAGPLSNEAVATPNPVTPPTTRMTAAQAIAAARAFCASIGRTISSTDSGAAQYPIPTNRRALAASFNSSCWWVTFENGELRIGVCDATGVITTYHDGTSIRNIALTPPTGSQITASTATQTFSTVIAASLQTDPLATPSAQFESLAAGSTVGDICTVRAQRMALGYPFLDQSAAIVLQAETGTLLSYGLNYPTASPTTVSNTISQGAAASTAGTVLSTAGQTNTTFVSATEMWVEPNLGWPASESTVPTSERLAWVVVYSTPSAVLQVWVDAGTGAVIGGLDGITGEMPLSSKSHMREVPAKNIRPGVKS